MAKEKFPHVAIQKLLNADSTLSTTDLNAVAGITTTAAELNYVAGATAGVGVASKAAILGANTELRGWRRGHVADADGLTVTAAHSGAILTNAGAVGMSAFAMPAALVGMEFYFFVLAAQVLRIDPNLTETIGLPSSGVQQAAGKYIEADAVGEYVHIFCAVAGQWETLDYRGTWVVEG